MASPVAIGDRIGPPRTEGGSAGSPEGPAVRTAGPSGAGLAIGRDRPGPCRVRARGIVRLDGECPAPWPAAGPAATPHVRGGALFDNPVSASSQSKGKSVVSSTVFISERTRTRPAEVAGSSLLCERGPSVARRHDAAGMTRCQGRQGGRIGAFGPRAVRGVGSAWSSPQGHGGDA